MAICKTVNYSKKYHDYQSKEDVIKYILNPFKTPSGYVGFMNVDANNISQSMHQLSASFQKDNGIQIRHMVVSFKENEVYDYATANAIAYEFMSYIGQEYPCFYAVHENKENIHFHIAFNNVGLTGKRYYGTKAEYYSMMNALKSILRRYGVKVLIEKYGPKDQND